MLKRQKKLCFRNSYKAKKQKKQKLFARVGAAPLRVSAQKHNQTIKSGNSKKNQKNNQNH